MADKRSRPIAKEIIMSKKIRWITETAVMLALLVALQALTKPMGQLVTGSCVNAVLAVSALVGGLSSGLVVALVSPVLAFLLGIAPQILTVPAIMAAENASLTSIRPHELLLLYPEAFIPTITAAGAYCR